MKCLRSDSGRLKNSWLRQAMNIARNARVKEPAFTTCRAITPDKRGQKNQSPTTIPANLEVHSNR